MPKENFENQTLSRRVNYHEICINVLNTDQTILDSLLNSQELYVNMFGLTWAPVVIRIWHRKVIVTINLQWWLNSLHYSQPSDKIT
jgi:hypothetical protein